ncbi:MAG TPA: PilZ domain-containing protein [Halothiobacillus sp.]|nr:PilZ domain-containing protein [Halothiobacillus sp.]
MDNTKSPPKDVKNRIDTAPDTNNDRRDFNRKRKHGNVLLRVKTPPGTIHNAHLVDVSASGINITLNEPIVVGTQIQLAVKFEEHNEHFFVSGVVARSMPLIAEHADNRYQLGVELQYEKNNPDFHDWRALFIA